MSEACALRGLGDNAVMPAARGLDAKLAALRGDPGVDAVRDALRSSTGALVAAAVRIAAARGVLLDELPPAFERLCERPEKRDPGCRGKIAIARALVELERWEPDVFVPGARFVQSEPVWGGAVDTAAELRGVSAIAHARFARPDALDVLAELLADRERMARIAAAQGIGDAGREGGAALLRYKLLQGDDEPEVLSAACESLLHLQRDDGAAFLARLLERTDDRAEIAALALGASRLPAAVAPLRAWCDRCAPDVRRRVGYLALALTRDVNDALLAIVDGGEPADALAAAKALATFRDDPALRDALVRAARGRRAIEAVLD